MPKFVHLHTHSHYSLLDGLTKIGELVERVKELDMDAAALTDHGNLYGSVEFYKTATKAGIKPILGVECYLAPLGRLNKRPRIDDTRYHLPLLAKNQTGWKNLLGIVTKSYLEGFYYKPRIDRGILKEHAEGLICLSGCFSGEMAKLIAAQRITEAEEAAKFYRELFGGDFYIELQPHAPDVHDGLLKIARKLGIKPVATQDAHYLRKEDKTAHEILLAVQTQSKLDDEDRFSMKKYDLHFSSTEEMAEHFKNLPEALENTLEIAGKCNVQLDLKTTRLPKFPMPDNKDAHAYLKELVKERLPERFPEETPVIRERLEKELKIIHEMGFDDYFLIVQDFVNWAKDHGIVVGPGRGSAAGSLISYILKITNIDPLKYDLLFERFLNPGRNEVPDIDIDFTDTRRDEVVAYVREKHGPEHVAQIITFGTMMARAAIRDTARALGLPYSLGDELAKLIPFHASLKEAIETVPELKEAAEKGGEDKKRVLELAARLEGTVRHASVHACGVVISAEPLTEYLPLQYAPQDENTILTQIEMHGVESLGLLKMDFLGLKNLTIIERTIRLIDELHSEKINLDKLPLNDEKTFQLLQSAECTGVFQLESAGMRRYLKELVPTELEDIIAMISLYRPGPMELIPQYIARKHGKERVGYIHPRLEPILKNTYGVGVYQEQMMRIARDLGGFTLSEADTLRKAIGKKVKELLEEQRVKLIDGMLKNGIDRATAEKVWDLFPPFARYGFNRSHAACYALIAYQTAYLKAHYPVEFITGLLNTVEGDIDRVNFLINDAKRLGIEVLPPDINASYENFAPDDTGHAAKRIRFGLSAVKNVGENIVREIIGERLRGGNYRNLTDLLTRISHRDMNKKSLESLIKCGAFDSLHPDRGELLGNIDEIVRFNQAAKKLKESNQTNLFGGTTGGASLRLKPAEKISKSTFLAWEKELLGLYITDHPFKEYLEKVRKVAKPIREVLEYPRGSAPANLCVAGIASVVKKIVTKKGEQMAFVTLDDATDRIETLVFPKLFARDPKIWQEGKFLILAGVLSWRDQEPKIICNEVRAL